MTESLSQGEDIRLSKILIFAGTTEGRKLSEHLCERGIEHTVCVATEYGEIVLQEIRLRMFIWGVWTAKA